MWITCVYMAFGGVSEGIIYGEEYRGERNADVNGNTSRQKGSSLSSTIFRGTK